MAEAANLPNWFASLRSLVRSEPLNVAQVATGGLALVGAPKRPELNGKLLHNPAGTIWQVIDGVARGFVSEDLFLRLHSWTRDYTVGSCGSAWPPRAGICAHIHQAVALMEVPNVPAFIEEQGPFDASVRLISNAAGTVCLYESNTKRLVPNPETMDKYQFDWSKVMVLAEAVFDAIPPGPAVPA